MLLISFEPLHPSFLCFVLSFSLKPQMICCCFLETCVSLWILCSHGLLALNHKQVDLSKFKILFSHCNTKQQVDLSKFKILFAYCNTKQFGLVRHLPRQCLYPKGIQLVLPSIVHIWSMPRIQTFCLAHGGSMACLVLHISKQFMRPQVVSLMTVRLPWVINN